MEKIERRTLSLTLLTAIAGGAAVVAACTSTVTGTGTGSSSSSGSSGGGQTSSGSLGSSGGSSGGSSSSSSGTPDVQQRAAAIRSCLDLVDAVARAYERCGFGTYSELYPQVMDQAAKGSCTNIVGIKDETVLRNQCLPWLKTADCTALGDGKFDASCVGQLLVDDAKL